MQFYFSCRTFSSLNLKIVLVDIGIGYARFLSHAPGKPGKEPDAILETGFS